MKILFLFPRFGIGGIAKAMSYVAKSCDEANMETVCVSMSDEPIMIDLPIKSKLIYLDYYSNSNVVSSVLHKIKFLIDYRRIIMNENPDVIVSFGVDNVRISVLASVGLKQRIIGSERGNPYVYNDTQRKKYCAALNKCNAVVFQTENARAYYPDSIKSKSFIILNPCVVKSETDHYLSDGADKILLVYSRLSEEKNIEGVINALEIAKKKLEEQGSNVRLELHIYGDGERKKDLEKQVRDKSIKEIIFFPSHHDVLGVEKRVDAFILNSDTEGFPNALIEAMISGIPCIATNCPPGGVNFLADGGRRVHMIPVRDDVALADAIIKVSIDKRYARSLITASKELKIVLDPERIKKEWVKLIENVGTKKNNHKVIKGI